MSDILSQDQLDQLLNQQDLAGGPGAAFGSDDADAGASKNYDSLAAAFGFFNETASGVITNVINRDVTLNTDRCSPLDPGVLSAELSGTLLMVTLPFTAGIDGSLYFIIGTAETALLADLMLMGDGTVEYNADHKDAIAELFNQVTGALVPAFGKKTGKAISFGPMEVVEFDIASPPFALRDADVAIVRLSVADKLSQAAVALIAPNAVSDELMQLFADMAGAGGMSDKGIGLNTAELDDLSKVTGGFGDSGSDRFRESSLSENPINVGTKESVEMLLDVELDVCIELGRSNLSIKRILDLAPGSIVELDRMAGEPVDLLVNNKVVAKGEVVVVDENFGIRIVSLISTEDRIKSLR